MIEDYYNTLRRDGVVELDLGDSPNQDLVEIASIFGEVVPGARGEMIQLLPARDKGNGPIGSFSYKMGYGAFPWHTDTAYWDVPARYLLLTSSSASSCATLYQSFDAIREAIPDFDYLISRAVFLLDIPGRKRYLSPCFKNNFGTFGIRLDFHIYDPMNDEAARVLDEVGAFLSRNYKRFLWTGNNALVIDNWRYIHAREDASEDKTRVLKRLYINELD